MGDFDKKSFTAGFVLMGAFSVLSHRMLEPVEMEKHSKEFLQEKATLVDPDGNKLKASFEKASNGQEIIVVEPLASAKTNMPVVLKL